MTSSFGSNRTEGVADPQGGIFALGTASHAYLEFDAVGAILKWSVSPSRVDWASSA